MNAPQNTATAASPKNDAYALFLLVGMMMGQPAEAGKASAPRSHTVIRHRRTKRTHDHTACPGKHRPMTATAGWARPRPCQQTMVVWTPDGGAARFDGWLKQATLTIAWN